MKRLLRLAFPLALLFVLSAGTSQAQAGCPCGGKSLFGDGWSDRWPWPYFCALGGFDAWTFIEVAPNLANVYPDGGFTAYDGMWGTGFQARSNYAPVNWIVPPAASAQMVLNKLKEMNIPLVSPEPMFLGKNPRIADNVRLPTPRPKKTREEE
jgi:hypothetical protein